MSRVGNPVFGELLGVPSGEKKLMEKFSSSSVSSILLSLFNHSLSEEDLLWLREQYNYRDHSELSDVPSQIIMVDFYWLQKRYSSSTVR